MLNVNKYCKILIVLLSIFSESVFSQTNSPNDIFPLLVKNKWIYSYEMSSSSSMVHFSSSESGTCEYEIIGNDSVNSTIIWHFIQRRKFIRNTYGIPSPQNIQDSAKFDIIEFNNGFHEIYTPIFNEFSAFPFQRVYVDSLKFYRFIDSGTISKVYINLEYPDKYNPIKSMNYKYQYTICKDTGIVSLSYNRNGISSKSSSFYSLKEFKKYSPYQSNNFPANLIQNYPNPFNGITRIKFNVASKTRVEIKIYNILGELISTLVDGFYTPSEYEIRFNGKKLASGVYLCVLQTDNHIQTKKLLLLK